MESSEKHAPSHSSSPTREPGAPRPKGKSGLIWLAAIIVIALVTFRVLNRVKADHEVAAMTRELAVPTVQTTLPLPSPSIMNLDLPGSVSPFQQTALYARTNGYIQRWLVDIGAQVKAGQLLAEIDAPDLDQQILQAEANVAQSQTNLDLAKTTAQRWTELLKQGATDQQTSDEKTSAYTAATATLKAQQASLAVFQQMKDFQKITAPFAGTITTRNVNVGDLVNSSGGTSGTMATELFSIQQDDPLRIFVNVPETLASDVKLDASATAELASSANQKVAARVARTASTIDPASRTLLVELDVPNADHKLFAGGYAMVHFPLAIAHPTFVLPVNALLFRPGGTEVGIVGNDDTVKMTKIQIGKDYGTTVEVASGLESTDRVILNPSDSLATGDKVRIDNTGQVSRPATTAK